MSDVRYELNRAGLAEVALSDDMGRAMNDYAHAGIGVFESIAPRRTGKYADSAEVIDAIDSVPTPRRVAHLVATADHSAKVEWGDPGGQPREGHHTLARVADIIEGTA